jgi:hypothetical protein
MRRAWEDTSPNPRIKHSMKSARRSRLACALGVTFVVGCGSRGNGSGGLDASLPDSALDQDAAGAQDAQPGQDSASALADSGACGAIGATCGDRSECCSNYCTGGVCACNSAGYACSANADCCGALTCEGLVCVGDAGVVAPVEAGPLCAPTGSACQTNSSCCTDACMTSDAGSACCLSRGGPFGTQDLPCTSDDDCCSGSCWGDGVNTSACLLGTVGGPCVYNADCGSNICSDNRCQCAPSGPNTQCFLTGDCCADNCLFPSNGNLFGTCTEP